MCCNVSNVSWILYSLLQIHLLTQLFVWSTSNVLLSVMTFFPEQFTNKLSFKKAKETVLLEVANAKSIHVFADFSLFLKADQKPLARCLCSVMSMTRIVMSLSSGAENMLFKGKDVAVVGHCKLHTSQKPRQKNI